MKHYQHSHEYFLGEEMLVAPVLDPRRQSDHLSYLRVKWIDFFTGLSATRAPPSLRRYAGGLTRRCSFAKERSSAAERKRVLGRQAARHPDPQCLRSPAREGQLRSVQGRRCLARLRRIGQHAQTLITCLKQRRLISPRHRTDQGYVSGPGAGASLYELRIHAADEPSSLSVNGEEADPLDVGRRAGDCGDLRCRGDQSATGSVWRGGEVR